jgi:hypothetical protein
LRVRWGIHHPFTFRLAAETGKDTDACCARRRPSPPPTGPRPDPRDEGSLTRRPALTATSRYHELARYQRMAPIPSGPASPAIGDWLPAADGSSPGRPGPSSAGFPARSPSHPEASHRAPPPFMKAISRMDALSQSVECMGSNGSAANPRRRLGRAAIHGVDGELGRQRITLRLNQELLMPPLLLWRSPAE